MYGVLTPSQKSQMLIPGREALKCREADWRAEAMARMSR